jgi:hypothetical protein
MLPNQMRLMVIASLFFGLLLGIFIGFRVSIAVKAKIESHNSLYRGQAPIKSVAITINESQQRELFDKFQIFADKNAFAIRIGSPLPPNFDSFLVQMFRDDIHVISTNSFDPGEFSVGFFDINPAKPTREEIVDARISDLESLVSEIPKAQLIVE